MPPAKVRQEENSGLESTALPGLNILLVEATIKLLKTSGSGALQVDDQFSLFLLLSVNWNTCVGDTGDEGCFQLWAEGQKMISVSSDTQVHLNCFWQTISFLFHDFFYLLLKSAEGILLCVVMKMLVGYRTVYV